MTAPLYGQGCTRSVYLSDDDPTGTVVKVLRPGEPCHCTDTRYDFFCPNAVEAIISHATRGTASEGHVARVYDLSPDHRTLRMERVLDNTWGDTPSHQIKSDLILLGIYIRDTIPPNGGRREPSRESVYLDYGCWDLPPALASHLSEGRRIEHDLHPTRAPSLWCPPIPVPAL